MTWSSKIADTMVNDIFFIFSLGEKTGGRENAKENLLIAQLNYLGDYQLLQYFFYLFEGFFMLFSMLNNDIVMMCRNNIVVKNSIPKTPVK